MRAPPGNLSLAKVFCLSCLALSTLPDSLAAQQQTPSAAVDPIVGIWSLDGSQGERYEYTMNIKPDGTVDYRLMGERFQGTWKKTKGNRYIMAPGNPEDFAQLRSGKLEQWDATGFIRAFNRSTPRSPAIPATREQAAVLRREAQDWAYANFTPGMYWNVDNRTRFVAHMSTYSISKASPPYQRAFYFARANLTVLVDDHRGVAMALREGRVSH